MSDHDLPHGFEVQFNTAWAPPQGICRAIREQYPDIDINGSMMNQVKFAGYL